MTSIGIDLGTSNSVVSYVDKEGKVVIIPNMDGGKTTPSIVKIEKGEVIVGVRAQQDYKLGAPNTVGSFKVNMGSAKKYVIEGKQYTPTELSSFILKYLKDSAEAFLGEPVKKAVITVPAYFEEPQRKQTILAGEMVGLEVMRCINEPTAASLAYGIDNRDAKTVLVYDLGGGTFDASILQIETNFTNGKLVVESLGSKGHNQLGGDDLDIALSMNILRSLKTRDKYVPSFDHVEKVMKEMSRTAKETLSTEKSVELPLAIIERMDNKAKFSKPTIKITRSQYKAMVLPYIDRTIEIIKSLLEEEQIDEDEIDAIILVGGSTKSPLIEQILSEAFDIKILKSEVDPDLIVGAGAAVQASIIEGGTDDLILLDVTPLNLIIELHDGMSSVVIKANSPIPVSKSRTYENSYDDQTKMEFRIYQGNHPVANRNTFLGTLELNDLIPMPKGMLPIDLTLSLNENGELSAKALDILSGNEVVVNRIFKI